MSFVINSGPFKGTTPDPAELDSVTRDDEQVPLWGTHHRTRVFLEKFNPLEGWAVETKVKKTDVQLEDLYTLADDGNPAIQPTREFIATLKNPEGKVIASASVLKIINSEFSWKAGLTAARGALYESLGLPSTIEASTEVEGLQDETKPITKKVDQNAAPANSGVDADSKDETELVVVAIGKSESTYKEPDNLVSAEAFTSNDAETATSDEAESSTEVASKDEVNEEEAEATSKAPDASESDATEAKAARPKPQQGRSDREAKARASLSKAVNGVPVGIARRITKLYKEAGLEVPEYNGVDEATQLLSTIMEHKTGRGSPVQGAIV